MKRKVAILVLLALALIGARAEDYAIDSANASNFGQLFIGLLHAYERPSEANSQAIFTTLEAIRRVSPSDYDVAMAVARHWYDVYIDPNYTLNLYRGEERATALEGLGLGSGANHAIVVLGYELKNGRMRDELRDRCDAAAAAARALPEAIIVCSGGPTGSNNPQGNTEAGLMKAYLVGEQGIDPSRIYIDEEAMSTVQNATNTFEILSRQNIASITIVTSSYHQRWGQVIYNAMSALWSRSRGYSVRIVGNYCFPKDAPDTYRHDDRWAIRQLTTVFALPEEVVEEMKRSF